jgi:hypothetical protein
MGGNVEMEDVNRTTSHEVMDELGKIPLYQGSTLSSLAATLLTMNCCKTHETKNAFVNELLGLLKWTVLPQPNTLPTIGHEATTILNKLGLTYNVIHLCSKGCMFFCGPHERVDRCLKCGEFKYKVHGRSIVPQKVLKHFSIIPPLQRMYGTSVQVNLMTWHSQNKSMDGMVRHVTNSRQWKFIDERWPEFAQETHNVQLGLVTNGLNPFGEKWST